MADGGEHGTADWAIPVLDLNQLDKDLPRFAAEAGRALTETGFIGLTGHGIPAHTIDTCRAAARAFFALPREIKQRYRIAGGGGQRGFTPFAVETPKDATDPDLKEFWHMGRDLPAGHPLAQTMPANLWPEEVEGFATACRAFYTAMDMLGRQLLRAIAVFLSQPEDYFEDRVALGNSILRLLHYPPVAAGSAGERAGAHEDINVITLLVGADQAGLEILHRDGTWVPIVTGGDTIVCNVGDMLERLTNHVLPSTTHRVIRPAGASETARYSMPFFLHFRPDVNIATLSSCKGGGRPDRYPEPISAKAFLEQRLREIRLT